MVDTHDVVVVLLIRLMQVRQWDAACDGERRDGVAGRTLALLRQIEVNGGSSG